MSEVFIFVDASHLISKANLWEERDEARKQKYEKLNNEVLPSVANDKQADRMQRGQQVLGMVTKSMLAWICSQG